MNSESSMPTNVGSNDQLGLVPERALAELGCTEFNALAELKTSEDLQRLLDAYAEDAVAAERERCAKAVEPTTPRGCDCSPGCCYCGNIGDAQAVAAWDEATSNAKLIRGL